MRVIAGKARRLPLKTVQGLDTRPTTDRIKETLFNILQNDLYNIRFLDLFSGSGGIGIEALSRGAREAYFVDSSRAAAACIRDNLEFTHLTAQAKVFSCDVMTALSRFEKEEPFQIIFMDPPYGKELERRVLEYLSARPVSFYAQAGKSAAAAAPGPRGRAGGKTASYSIANEETLIIVEASAETDFSYAEALGYSILREKNYKTNKHVFLKLRRKGYDL